MSRNRVKTREQDQQDQEQECSTFQVLSRQQNRAHKILLDQDADLIRHRGAIKAHHKQLAELSVMYASPVSAPQTTED